MRVGLTALALGVLACGEGQLAGMSRRMPLPDDSGNGIRGAECTLVETVVPAEGDYQIAEGELPVYAANPPASGPHYQEWARWEAFDVVIPRGYWMHNAAHGGVVFLVRPFATDTAGALLEVYEQLPPDPECGHRRALLTADPELDDLWAIVAWGVTLTGDCLDAAAIREFAEQHRGQGHESVCEPGAYPY